MAIGWHGRGAVWSWGSVGVVVSEGPPHQYDTCDMSLLAPLAVAVHRGRQRVAAYRGWQRVEGGSM